MGDISTENLIDFNIEETPRACCDTKPFTSDHVALIPSPRLSLENNPFDLVQKQTVFRPDDPFDVVEKEATLKARQICSKSVEVKLGNLLSLSEDNETAAASTADSNVFYTAEEHELENESPPISLSSKWSPCSSTASCDSSDSNKDQPCGAKSRKVRNHRNRLLKLSISNAAFSTPNSSRPGFGKEDALINNFTEKLVSLPGDNEESSIDSESPVKLIDEDLKLDNSKKRDYTEKDYDLDLEMMKIPMLRQLPSPEKIKNSNQLQECDKVSEKLNSEPMTQSNAKLNKLPDLEELRLKLRAKRLESNNHEDISELINDFKNLISETKMIDEHNKQAVDGLLKTLTSTLSAVKTSPEITQEVPPQPIVRQGTFDMDLQDNDQLSGELTTELIGGPANIEDMPDAMLKSSATYDGETAEDKAHLNLPQIDPPSPDYKQPIDANFQCIIDQLQQFLEHQHLSSENSDASHASSSSSTVTNNPTFIVVMPTIAQNAINEESYDRAASYRRRSQSLSLHDKLKIVQLPIKTMPEIQLTENYESPPLNSSSSYITPLSSDFKTPSRFLERRNSFSSVTPLTPGRFSRFNQSTMGKDRSSGYGMRSEIQQSGLVQRPTLGMKLDPKKKVRATSSLIKSNAPLKATLPYKQAATVVKTAPSSMASMRTSASNTSMHLLVKGGQMSHTSTPMPAPRANGLRPLNKVLPNISTAPTGATKATANSSRYSNNAMTPIGKTLSAPPSTAHLRRRTISELKAKSPNKPRASFSNLKSNLSRPLTSAAKNTIRPTVGVSSAYPAIKNKENKQPHH